MKNDLALPVEDVLRSEPSLRGRREIGRSREMRPVYGYLLGEGAIKISLIAGCHADEPVGPATLTRLVAFLSGGEAARSWLSEFTWQVVPHANPDGRYRNRHWIRAQPRVDDYREGEDDAFDLGLFLDHVTRELPGDDIEFGFPRDRADREARPENLAIADFLSGEAPYDLHGSLHGMAFAPGPWFLIEESWSDRTVTMRNDLRHRVRELGYDLFDPDRKGEKGFRRIDEGFTSRPDSRAMRSYFEERDDPETAARFRPSSMELVRDLGGDPFTFVSEMPLFLTPSTGTAGASVTLELQELRRRLAAGRRAGLSARDLELRESIRPMPVRDQQRLQLHFLAAAITAVVDQ